MQQRSWAELAVFLLLLVAPAINGYPFLHADSFSYLGFDTTFTRSPVVSFVTRPLLLLFGVWGSVLLQAVIGAILIVAVARNISEAMIVPQIVLAAVLSGALLLPGQILADVWLLFGVLAVYLVAVGWFGFAGICMVALCTATHYGNFLVLPPLLFFALWLLAGHSLVSSLLRSGLTLVMAVIIVMAASLFWGAPKLFGSSQSYTWIGGKVIYNMPEVVDVYCQTEPMPKLCQYRETFEFIRANGGAHHIIWDERSPRKDPDFGPLAFDDASRDLAILSLDYPMLHLKTVYDDFALLLRGPWFLYGYDLSRDMGVPMAQHLPEELSDFEGSWQSRLGGFDPQSPISLFMGQLVGLMLIAGILVLLVLLRRPGTPIALVRFGIYAYLALLVNDLVFAALSGPYSRYHYRLVFPALFFLIVALFHLARAYRSRSLELAK